MLKKYRVFLTIIICVSLYIFLYPGNAIVPAEEIDIPAGISLDLEKTDSGEKYYKVAMNVYTFPSKDKIESLIISGEGNSIAESREYRQLKSNHKFLYGLEKALLYSEDIARDGLTQAVDILFSNQFISDMGWMIICKGHAAEVLKVKIDNYPTSADFIEGMIKHCNEQNFFSDNYKILDVFVRLDAEGRNLVLPYIEIKNNHIEITGTAIFNKDKMVQKLDIEDTKIMNLMRENNVRGILTIDKNFYESASIYCKAKHKIKCQIDGDGKFNFYIDVDITGDVLSNTLYDDLMSKPEVINKFKDDLEQQTKQYCMDFIDKMQKEFKLDCLDLGRYAVAKYGRGTGIDWNEVVSESKIEVNINIKIDRFGRGLYTVKAD